MSLMRVTRLQDIGEKGPGDAAQPLPEHRHVEQLSLLGALFGRDSLYMGLHLYNAFPILLRTTLVRLAESQGVTSNIAKEEEPGRIVHWQPDPGDPIAAEIARVNNWEWPNYGAVDTTPLFIRGVVRAASDDPSFLRTVYRNKDGDDYPMYHALGAAAAWLYARLESNPEGLLEFQMRQPRGIWNQAWKDTPESYMHADGSYANHHRGIASIEVQALAYDTLIELAQFYRHTWPHNTTAQVSGNIHDSNVRRAATLADKLKTSVLDNFWIDDERGGYFALGTDRDRLGRIRRLAVRTSNMGHALHLLDGDDSEMARRRRALIRTLFSDELLDRNGVRTLSSLEVRFVPRSYHCGSVWMWDTHAIAGELRRAGYPGLAHELDMRTWHVINDLGFFAEFVPGDNSAALNDLVISKIIDVYDGEREHWSNSYRIEKPAQEIQAWTVEAIRAIKKANSPLHPDRSLPTASADPNKRRFELEILGTVVPRTTWLPQDSVRISEPSKPGPDT